MRRRYLRFCTMLMVLSVLSGFVGSAAPAQASSSDPYVPNEVLVKLNPGVLVSAVALAYGLLATPLDQLGSLPIYRLRILEIEARNSTLWQVGDSFDVELVWFTKRVDVGAVGGPS